MKERCPWHGGDELMIHYHDTEWGVPLHDDIKLFEFMIFDAFQAGLSWSTILKKRENFRTAFDNFIPEIIANYNQDKIDELLNNAGIIRNKLKINATIENAKAFLNIQKEYGSFDKYIWQFTNNETVINKWSNIKEVPSRTLLSDEMSKQLKKQGFKFVGSTICYSFMQAAGMVNDHIVNCFRYNELCN